MTTALRLTLPQTALSCLWAWRDSNLSFRPEAEQEVEVTLYDTFDWRLYNAGLSLKQVTLKGSGTRWVLGGLADGVSVGAYPTRVRRGNLRFAWDFPAGTLRNRLSGLIEMRALLPLVTFTGVAQSFSVLNSDDKTVARGRLEQLTAAGSDGVTHSAYLRALRGYDKQLERAGTLLEQHFGAHVAPGTFVQAVLGQGQGKRAPGGYSSKLNFTLDGKARADEVAREVHRYLLATLKANLEGVCADVDSEFLHDFRVATRRIRSALTQIKGVFPEDVVLERFKTDFGWLGQITGPTRDMDVYLLKFPAYRDSLPEWVRADLDPYHSFIVQRKSQEQKKLAKSLSSERFLALMRDWESFLESDLDENPTAPNALRPVHKVASGRIWKLYRRVLKEGRLISPASPAEVMHELRKDCKKLRYLMEFFQSLYPEGDFKRSLKSLKTLLDNLGDFQDFEVQAHSLRQIGEEMSSKGLGTADVLIAMGILVGDLLQGQRRAHEAFSATFAQFASVENQQAFSAIFEPSASEI